MSLIERSQLRAARALLGWSQEKLAEASGVSIPTIKRLEPGEGPLATKVETMEKLRQAFEAAGIEFTNDGLPGVRATPVWLLHRVAERADLDAVLELNGRGGFWIIKLAPKGLACENQHGELMGSVTAGTSASPEPKFDPPIGQRRFGDRATPADLHLWITGMRMRDAARGTAARAFDAPDPSD